MEYQIRQLSLGGVLDDAIALTKDHFGAFVAIVGVTLFPALLANSLAQLAYMPPLSFPPNFDELRAYALVQQEHGALFNLLSGWSLLSLAIGKAAIVQSIASAYRGQSITMKAALMRAFKTFFPMIGTTILVSLAVAVGVLGCLVPGILFALWFSFTTPIVVIEGMFGAAAMKRSKLLAEDNLVSLFVMGLVVGVITWGVVLASMMIPQPLVRAVLSALVQSVMTAFESATIVVFYFSARCQHEQFDLQLLADNVSAEVVLEAVDEIEQDAS